MGYINVVTSTVICVMFHIYLSNELQSTVTGKSYHINFKFDCNSINVIYL